MLENGEAVLEGEAADLRQRDDIKAFYLGARPRAGDAPGAGARELSRHGLTPTTLHRGAEHERPAQAREHRRGCRRPAQAERRRPTSSRSDAEAIAVAHGLPPSSPKGASERDRERRLPVAELDAFSQSGLWSINVPKAFGGPEVSYVTLARVIAIISAADPSIGQIPQNHLGVVAAIRTVADEAQQKLLFARGAARHPLRQRLLRVRHQARRRVRDHASPTQATMCSSPAANSTRPARCSRISCRSSPLDDEGRAWYAIAERGAPGLTVIDDWSSFGQRTTASGHRDARQGQGARRPIWYPATRAMTARPPTAPIFQIIQAAVDAGIAHAAIDETIDFVRTKSRPWIDSGARPRLAGPLHDPGCRRPAAAR